VQVQLVKPALDVLQKRPEKYYVGGGKAGKKIAPIKRQASCSGRFRDGRTCGVIDWKMQVIRGRHEQFEALAQSQACWQRSSTRISRGSGQGYRATGIEVDALGLLNAVPHIGISMVKPG
jgi:hypothetical protein